MKNILTKLPWDFLAAICIVAGLIYLVIFRAPLQAAHVTAEARSAIDKYLQNPTASNLDETVTALKECDSVAASWSCRIQFSDESFLTALITNNHIETLIAAGAFDEARTTQQVKAWTQYSGNSPDALLRKAEYFSKAGDYKNALITFKNVFDSGHDYETAVATRLLRIYGHFGCTDDIAIWSEWSDPKYTFDEAYLFQNGTDYPKQSRHLSDAEIADRRVNLRRGQFQGVTPDCPVSKFFK